MKGPLCVRYLSTLVLLGLTLLLGGCVSAPQKKMLKMGIDTRPEVKQMMWPAEQDGQVPRYLYLGELTGENNFVHIDKDTDTTKSAIARFFDIIVGEEPPKLLERPQSGAVDEAGRVLVTDMSSASVFVFDEKEGKLSIWEKASGLTSFISPVAIAIGPEGQVFVSDSELALIARFNRDGKTLAPIGKGQLRRPTGVAYEPKTQRLFVADTQDHQIKVFDLEGKLLTTIGEHGEGPGEFNFPTHIAVLHEKLYVSDTINARVQVISTPTGRYLGELGKRGMKVGNLVRPKGVATDSEHNVYVVESYFDYLLIYNRRGEFLLPIGGNGQGPGNFHLPAGVWLDSRNRVFVADMLNGRVAVFQFLGGDDDDDNW